MANQQLTSVRIWATNGESGEPAVAVSSITSFTSGQLKFCHGFLNVEFSSF
jgi:hypothetical protein